jgi:hypothetical protein
LLQHDSHRKLDDANPLEDGRDKHKERSDDVPGGHHPDARMDVSGSQAGVEAKRAEQVASQRKETREYERARLDFVGAQIRQKGGDSDGNVLL